MAAYLEHANITVPDIDAAIAFLRCLAPDCAVRYDEVSPRGYRWAHVGVGDSYIALQAPHVDASPAPPRPPYRNYGVNHLAWVVDDFDAAVGRLEAAGYRRGMPVGDHPFRRRAYFYDAAGLEWELVHYLSDDPAQRHAPG